jgi:hypothetical protein
MLSRCYHRITTRSAFGAANLVVSSMLERLAKELCSVR